jgi:hypothetical protein
MENAAGPLLASWNSYYVIIGSSSAALTGLMFVVVSLMPESRLPASERAVAAFATPTIVHFCAALLVSAILSAPWPTLAQAGIAAGVCGFAGIGYTAIVMWRTHGLTEYKAVLEDWLWHSLFPLIAYITISIAGVTLSDHPVHAPFALAAASVLLLFIGIHNAWDTVTYMALARTRERAEAAPPPEPPTSYEL